MALTQWEEVKKRRRQHRNSQAIYKARETWIRKKGRLPGQRYSDIVHTRYKLREKWHTENLIKTFYLPFLNLKAQERTNLYEGIDLEALLVFWREWLEGLADVLDL